MLRQNGVVTVAELCSHCNCSAETARRDLRRLEDVGELVRTHGGAVLAKGDPAVQVRTNGFGISETRTALVDRADALIITPKDTKTMRLLIERCRRAGVPIIAEATGYPGAKTVVAVDNYRAGYELGQAVAAYAKQHMGETVTVLSVSYPQPNTEARSRGFEDGLRELPANRRTILHVDGQGLREAARQITADALSVHPDVNVIFGVNDNSILGALDAWRALGLDESKLVLALFGLEGNRSRELVESGKPHTIAVAMFPGVGGPHMRRCGGLRLSPLRSARTDHHPFRHRHTRHLEPLLSARPEDRRVGLELDAGRAIGVRQPRLCADEPMPGPCKAAPNWIGPGL